MQIPQTERPGRFRRLLLAMLLVISMVTCIDRVNLSIAAKHIMLTYGLSGVDMGKIFSAFVFGYALFQIPAGWCGDKFGPRRLLTFAVLWWSVATALTALAGELFTTTLTGVLGSFILVRFLIGAGEAAAYPNFNRTIAFWMAPGERAFANSLLLGASGLGAAITPPLIGWIMSRYGWRESFFVCGAVGVFVALVWSRCSTDRPEQHPRVRAAELALICGEGADDKAAAGKLPFRRLLRSRNIWLLVASNFFRICDFRTPLQQSAADSSPCSRKVKIVDLALRYCAGNRDGLGDQLPMRPWQTSRPATTPLAFSRQSSASI